MEFPTVISLSPKAAPRRVAAALYGKLVAAARAPALYRELGIPDTIEGRYEMIVLHAALLLKRLGREGRAGAKVAQAVVDYMASDLDRSIRELGVGDLGVARYMKRLGEGLYGRAAAYSAALDETDTAALAEAIKRNAYNGADPGAAVLATFAHYVRRQAVALDNQGLASIAEGEVAFASLEGGAP